MPLRPLFAAAALSLAAAACATARPPEPPAAPTAAPAPDYLGRFRALVAALDADPRTRVTHFWVGEPASEAEIARVEAALGYHLSPDILAFYRQANGLQLRWLDVERDDYQPGPDDVTETTRTDYLQGDSDDATGLVNLLPLGEVFVDEDYEGRLWWPEMARYEPERFAGRTYDPVAFHRALRPVDPFSFYNSVAFFVADGRPDPPLIMGDDHDACWTDSRLIDFPSYLELLLHHRGRVQARRDALGEMFGHRQPPLRFSPRAARDE